MYLYTVTYRTNYGLEIMIIAAHNLLDASNLAVAHGAWAGYDCNQLTTGLYVGNATEATLLFHEGS